MGRTSMLFWWPKVAGLHIPMPETQIIKVPFQVLISLLDGKRLPKCYEVEIVTAAKQIGYPLFLRTDLASGKHNWEQTCFVKDEANLSKHIWALIDFNLALGIGELRPEALVLRKYIPLDTAFVAFRGLPIARERRYFIKNGELQCHHPYWIEDAIAKGWPPPKEKNWRQLLAVLNEEKLDEVRLLSSYSLSVARVLQDYWSVDFAHSEEGIWYLIDMAAGERSWHPNHKEADNQSQLI